MKRTFHQRDKITDWDTRWTRTKACVHARLYENMIRSFHHPIFIFLSPQHTQTHTDTDTHTDTQTDRQTDRHTHTLSAGEIFTSSLCLTVLAHILTDRFTHTHGDKHMHTHTAVKFLSHLLLEAVYRSPWLTDRQTDRQTDAQTHSNPVEEREGQTSFDEPTDRHLSCLDPEVSYFLTFPQMSPSMIHYWFIVHHMTERKMLREGQRDIEPVRTKGKTERKWKMLLMLLSCLFAAVVVTLSSAELSYLLKERKQSRPAKMG